MDGPDEPTRVTPRSGVREGSRESSRLEAARRMAKGVGAGVTGTVRVTQRGGGAVARLARRASSAQGAGETGLSRLIETHALSVGGDTAVTVGLAGTMFFSVGAAQARSQVAMFLVMTMLPFLFVAPLVGPFLDRYRHGRRWAIGVTMAGRAWLCWILAGAVQDESWTLFPAALGILVLSRGYGITRSAAVPRLLPEQLTLVKANGRMSLAGVVGGSVVGALAGGAAMIGPQWPLWVGSIVFALGTVMAILLPAGVDSMRRETVSMGEMMGDRPTGRPGRPRVPSSVVTALRSNLGLRALSGFATFFLAFLLREHPLAGWESDTMKPLLMALAIGGMGLGNSMGSLFGSVLRSRPPQKTVLVTLLLDGVVTLVAAFFWGLPMMLVLTFTMGLCQQMGKLALDALVQDEVEDEVRTSVFARSETVIQLGFVIGGGLGILLPMNARLSFGIIGVLLLVWFALVITWHQVGRGGQVVPVSRRGRGASRYDGPGARPVTPVESRHSSVPGPRPEARPSAPTEVVPLSPQNPRPQNPPSQDTRRLPVQPRAYGDGATAPIPAPVSPPPRRAPRHEAHPDLPGGERRLPEVQPRRPLRIRRYGRGS